MDDPVIDTALVRRLIATQFPEWSALPIRPVDFGGWDNRTFHLGAGMTVRLPSAAHYADQVAKEQQWLPILAQQLPLPIPVPLAMGRPDESYPWPWSIYEWRDGETALAERIDDLCEFATTLAGFLDALQAADATGGPPPGSHNFFRGGSLKVYDAQTHEALVRLDGRIDTRLATQVWDAALSTSWQGVPVWFHGDIAYGNLLVRNGRLDAVIDFGTSGVGDPACDLAITWHLFEGESREVFRKARPLDAGTWARGRGWTLWKSLIVVAGMTGANPVDVKRSWQVIDGVLADHLAWA
ncbi:Predicted kinase, aminoglycoside phosphotransferase (APT) family [Rhizobium tibeticum]|uniref:Aminoglycoside phosphotransferase n=1 Tax=Rhizobium tibeticum TaxID=501024 RepID=A0A1H8QPQ1_9HYPH|nr:aminoglycoside phosphotransferase family protein [Rhizobium tibeticum]SEI03803.1 Aminoglycoside phosphotransferase [Rhizobium tibeticum]SEO55844.1 Predicted kinase, aminoglycoside phosphotransferase (APT) family [Rhizobium tibeticum]